jgi:addiction module HigA family antidote
MPGRWATFGCRLPTGSKPWQETGADSIRSASTINGGFALSGEMDMRTRSKSSITTDLLPNPHPGEILLEEFLSPMELSQTALAKAIGVPPRRINEIVLGKRAITADTDLRLARYFRMSEGFFLGLQTDYELMQRRRETGEQLKAIKPRAA